MSGPYDLRSKPPSQEEMNRGRFQSIESRLSALENPQPEDTCHTGGPLVDSVHNAVALALAAHKDPDCAAIEAVADWLEEFGFPRGDCDTAVFNLREELKSSPETEG